ncbi:MAG: hypothetical protein Q7R76_00500 [Candidatus Woesearchaeota archaeon]|nr:hypothetical protein [Candidatus Woesearchaeota archaeon]
MRRFIASLGAALYVLAAPLTCSTVYAQNTPAEKKPSIEKQENECARQYNASTEGTPERATTEACFKRVNAYLMQDSIAKEHVAEVDFAVEGARLYVTTLALQRDTDIENQRMIKLNQSVGLGLEDLDLAPECGREKAKALDGIDATIRSLLAKESVLESGVPELVTNRLYAVAKEQLRVQLPAVRAEVAAYNCSLPATL